MAHYFSITEWFINKQRSHWLQIFYKACFYEDKLRIFHSCSYKKNVLHDYFNGVISLRWRNKEIKCPEFMCLLPRCADTRSLSQKFYRLKTAGLNIRWRQIGVVGVCTCHCAQTHQHHEGLQDQLSPPRQPRPCALRPARVDRRRRLQRRPGAALVIHLPTSDKARCSHDGTRREEKKKKTSVIKRAPSAPSLVRRSPGEPPPKLF